MMTELTRPQAEALAALIATLRDWDTRGTLTHLAEARGRGTAWDVAHAALYAAEDTSNRTPAVIPLAGPHWTRGKALGTAGPGADMPGRVRCTKPGHEHERAHNCRVCISEAKAGTNDTPTTQALRNLGVPRERVDQILADAGIPRTPDARTRATGDTP